MEWNNPGNEKIDFFDMSGGLIFWGAGEIGSRYLHIGKESGFLKAYVDNNDARKELNGVPIWSFEEMKEKRTQELIVLTLGLRYQREIIDQIEKAGLRKGVDYIVHSDIFIAELYRKAVHSVDAVYIPLAQISLTERCTLRCKKCAHGCNYVNNDVTDLPLVEAFKSADYFFKYTDYCEEFVLIGGETFLYKNIDKVINYIGEKYRNSINIFSITTNGTIIPNEKTLENCKKYNMLIRISNYEKQLHRLKERHEQLIGKLEEYGVSYVLGNEETEWMDYGFENADYGNDKEELIKHFDACKTPCREIQGSKYYYCVMAHTAGKNMNHKGYNPVDCLDLEQLDSNSNGKRIFLEYNLGYSEKGYLDMCRYCNGANAKNFPIPAAEQMREGE